MINRPQKKKTHSDLWNLMSNEFLDSKEWKYVRQIVLEESNYECSNCGSKENLQCDHIKPRVKDRSGKSWLNTENLQILCSSCHDKKGLSENDFRNSEIKEVLLEIKEDVFNYLKNENMSISWNVEHKLKNTGKKIKRSNSKSKEEKKANLYKGRFNAITTKIKNGELTEEQDKAINEVFKLFFK